MRCPLDRRTVIEDVRGGFFLEVLRWVLEEVEAMAVDSRKRCEGYEGLLLRNGHEDKQIWTLVGALRYLRIGLRCQGCGGEVYPLDRAMRFEGRDGIILGVRERVLWAAVEVSYEEANEFLEKFTGLEVRRTKIHRLAWEEGGGGIWSG